jgi:hypothetical protein
MNIATLFGQAYYDPYYDTGASTTSSTVEAGTVFVMILFILIFVLAAYAIQAFLLGRIFAKAGEKPWKAWVPIYNNWVMLELGGQQGFWAVLTVVPVVNIVSMVFMIIAMYHIGLKLGKEGAFVLLAIFIPIVWLIWLAVDGSTWKGKHVAQTAAAK